MNAAAADLLALVNNPDPPPFALLRRATAHGTEVELLTGEITTLSALVDLPLPGEDAPEMLVAVPFRQIAERGFDCQDDGEPIVTLAVDRRVNLPLDTALDTLPELDLTVSDAGFDIGDEEYAGVVEKIIDGEIRQGEGSNFVIRRSFRAVIEDYRPEAAMTIFRRLLTAESNAYWTFLLYTGERTFVGASPEQHVQVAGGTVRMNPISGTYRYPAEGADLAGLLDFLADEKEIDELYMVVDEELKMLAGVCDEGARVHGPYLREMARLAHTEYVLQGHSSMDVREVLRRTMFAPTIIGSPLENACRVITRHESSGRSYYGGVLALFGVDTAGGSTMDSAILIRTAELRPSGAVRIDVGATLVRHSQPAAEVAETWAKVSTLLAAIGLDPWLRSDAVPLPRPREPLAGGTQVAVALQRRNAGLSSFWFSQAEATPRKPTTGRLLVVDAEDTFTSMLGHQMRSFGLDVTIRSWADVGPDDVDSFDQVVLGPGPGNPGNTADPRIARLRELISVVLERRVPFIAECLSHQVLCSQLGMELIKRHRPNQGTRRRIDLFGMPEQVGFYNSYSARHGAEMVRIPGHGSVELCRDVSSGEIHALRGNGFASAQFHVESVLTERTEILAEMLRWAAQTTKQTLHVAQEQTRE